MQLRCSVPFVIPSGARNLYWLRNSQEDAPGANPGRLMTLSFRLVTVIYNPGFFSATGASVPAFLYFSVIPGFQPPLPSPDSIFQSNPFGLKLL